MRLLYNGFSKRSFWLFLSILLALYIFSSEFTQATTYYVHPDGGTFDQCTGLVDAPYPGSETNQPCAWSNPFWALDSNNPPYWRLQGGDTLIIYQGSYRMGIGAPNTGWCEAESSFDCHLPPLPSGPDPTHPTRILRADWDQGCPSPPELWGTERAWQIISLNGTSNAVISCLEITDHSGCVEFHANAAVRCERDTPPFGDWAHAGMYAADSSNVTLKDLNIHGFAEQGIRAGRISDWTVENVRIAGNGWAGWEGDLGEPSSNSGTLTFRRWTVEWNGCAETYPGEEPDHCWDQTAGGYGDGVGTGATGGHWIIEDSIFRYNTSDGLDLLYLGGDTLATEVEVRRTIAVGNAGNPIKLSGSSTIENSLIIANCGYFYQKPFGQEMQDHCRAGGNALALDLHQGNTVDVLNNTIVGQGDILVEIECNTASQCDGTEWVRLQNNIFVGYGDFLQSDWGDLTAFMWDPSNFSSGGIDYNVMYNVKFDTGSCPFGANDLCTDPLFVDSSLDSFDGHLQAGSPAIDSGLPMGSLNGLIPSHDLEGTSRPQDSGVDRGAFEYAIRVPAQVPSGQQSFIYNPVASPAVSTDPAQSKPIGIGSFATGGDTISLQISLGQFSALIDVYIGIYAPALDPVNVFIIRSDNSVSTEVAPWRENTGGNINAVLFGPISASSLLSGTYTVYCAVAPAGSLESFYLWTTSFVIP
ncbi:MAG: hypothetical protein JRG73_15455 [Deltaproteobacteria bacterium]|nr:hypothetical protein [Deltaproteobacteria bacterium]